jgi:hypothetical protein
MGRQNPVAEYHTDLLQANNLAANTNSKEDCDFLFNAVTAWLRSSGSVPSSHEFNNEYDDATFVMFGQLKPVRCDWQGPKDFEGIITVCPPEANLPDSICDVWSSVPDDVNDATTDFYADEFDLRVGGLESMVRKETALAEFGGNGTGFTEEEFYVKVIYNGSHFISLVYVPLHDQLLSTVRELLTPLLSLQFFLSQVKPTFSYCF